MSPASRTVNTFQNYVHVQAVGTSPMNVSRSVDFRVHVQPSPHGQKSCEVARMEGGWGAETYPSKPLCNASSQK